MSTGFGRYRCFCSWVPNSATGCGTPIDWCADNSTFLQEVWIFGGTTEIMKEIIGRGLGL